MHLVKSKSFCPQCIMVLAGSTELPRNRSDDLTERRWIRSTFPDLSLYSVIFDLNLLRPVPVLIYEYFNPSLTLPVAHTLAFPCLILSNPLCSGKIQPEDISRTEIVVISWEYCSSDKVLIFNQYFQNRMHTFYIKILILSTNCFSDI